MNIQAIFLALALFIISGCGDIFDNGKARDLTNHFWTYVNGDYYSEQNGYYIRLDNRTRTAEWYKPLAVGESRAGQVCYLGVKAKIESVTNGPSLLFTGNSSSSLRAKAIETQWHLVFTKDSPTQDEVSACDKIYRSNSYVRIDPIYVPVLAYGPRGIQLGHPQVCFFGCDEVKSLSTQDFSTGAASTYYRGAWFN